MKALRNYAKEKGVPISSLTDSEKEQFTKINLASSKVSNSQRDSIMSLQFAAMQVPPPPLERYPRGLINKGKIDEQKQKSSHKE